MKIDINELHEERDRLDILIDGLASKIRPLETEYGILKHKVDRITDLILSIQEYCHHDWKEHGTTDYGIIKYQKCIHCNKIEHY